MSSAVEAQEQQADSNRTEDSWERERAMEGAALRRLLHRLAGYDTIDNPAPEDTTVIDWANEAVERIERLEQEIARKQDREETREVLEGKPYNLLERPEKVKLLRDALIRKVAGRHDNRGVMEYGDVQTLFNNHPSPGHAYRLMELAGEAHGFTYQDNPVGKNNPPKRLLVNLDEIDQGRIEAATNEDTNLSRCE